MAAIIAQGDLLLLHSWNSNIMFHYNITNISRLPKVNPNKLKRNPSKMQSSIQKVMNMMESGGLAQTVIIMLRPLPSLAVRERRSADYISQALKNQAQELSFTYQESSSPLYPIINLRVIDFLNRKTIKKTHFIILNLNKCELNDEALSLLARGNWKSLRNLSLYSNKLTSCSFPSLSRASWKCIQQIDLSSNQFGNDLGGQLTDCNWGRLAHLDLSGNCTKIVCIAHLTGNYWKGLKSVNLSNNLLNNSSLPPLVNFEWLDLETLDLQRNLLTDDVMRVLVKGQWRKLQVLKLSYNPISANSLQPLHSNTWGEQLRIQLICNQDTYGNLLPFQMMITQNIGKAFRFLQFPQTKLTIILNKKPTYSIPKELASILQLRNISLVM